MNPGNLLRKVCAIALISLLAAPGCTATQPKKAAAGTPASAGSASADALLADAMQRQTAQRDAAQALSVVKAAAEKAPNRADIAWLHSQLCAQVAGCRPEPLESHLRKLDPGNASAWIGALARAQRQKDVAAENEILEAMSRSERFDIYWNSLVSKVALILSVDTAAQLGPTSPDLVTSNLNDAVGWVSSIAVPAFRPVAESCSTQRIANPAIATRCGNIAQALQRSDSYIAEGVGLGIAERLAAPGSQQAANVAEQIRRSRYQHDTAGQIVAAQLDREKFSREMLKLMANLRREQDVYLAMIRWSGQPVTPPPG